MPRIVAIADSDSYLKWSAATLAATPADWQHEQWLVRSPIAPSADQIRSATDDPVDRVTLPQLISRLYRRPPDVILLAATGPVVQAILSFGFLRRAGRRPVLVTGLPGISVPATERAIEFRAGCDLFIVHSHREVDEFAALAEKLRIPITFGLATLPFIRQAQEEADDSAGQSDPAQSDPVATPRPERTSKIIFAAQAKVPEELADRQQVLRSFAALPADRRVVIKLRALPGEQQTHRERLPYPELWDDLVRTEGLDADRIGFAGGSMAEALADADGFVTVSSTAALEAIGLGVPILVLSDFGVSAEAINEVFIGSGCLGTLDDLAEDGLRQPRLGWLRQNYFHAPQDTDWTGRIAALVENRASGTLPARDVVDVDGSRRLFRRQLRLAVPSPILRATGRLMRLRRRVQRRLVDPTPVEPGLRSEG